MRVNSHSPQRGRAFHLLAPSKSYKARRTATKHPSAIHRSHTRRRVCFTPGTNSAITAKPATVLALFLPSPRKPRKCASQQSVHLAPKKGPAFLGYSYSDFFIACPGSICEGPQSN